MKKKKVIIIASIALAIIFILMLVPRKDILKDGGTVRYKAALYSVENMHEIKSDGYLLLGLRVRVLGIPIVDKTHESLYVFE